MQVASVLLEEIVMSKVKLHLSTIRPPGLQYICRAITSHFQASNLFYSSFYHCTRRSLFRSVIISNLSRAFELPNSTVLSSMEYRDTLLDITYVDFSANDANMPREAAYKHLQSRQ